MNVIVQPNKLLENYDSIVKVDKAVSETNSKSDGKKLTINSKE